MDEQGLPDKNKKRKTTTGSGELGGSTSQVDSAKECEVHQERFLQLYEQ